jgi:hypothetical protein
MSSLPPINPTPLSLFFLQAQPHDLQINANLFDHDANLTYFRTYCAYTLLSTPTKHHALFIFPSLKNAAHTHKERRQTPSTYCDVIDPTDSPFLPFIISLPMRRARPCLPMAPTTTCYFFYNHRIIYDSPSFACCTPKERQQTPMTFFTYYKSN